MLSRVLSLLLVVIGLTPYIRAEDAKPLKVLWCTGGGFHDYKHLTPFLTQAIQTHANVQFDVSEDYKTWAEKGFADKYDAVVYYFSYHDKTAKPVTDNIAATIRAGKPAVFIHGTLHSFRELGPDRDPYCEAIGITSVQHDPLRPMATKKVADHPITRFWPEDWKTPHDELYQNVKVWPSTTPLMTAYSETSKKDHVVTWINQYGKARVFGTSLGHDKETAGMDVYPQLLANGLLWVCDELDENGKPKTGYAARSQAAGKPEAKGAKLSYQVYNGYFESNKSGLPGETSYLAFTDQEAFDRVFGKAVVMRKKQEFLPKDAFASELVAAAIKRGNKVWEYKVEGVTADGDTLSLRYQAASKDGGSATFASPLIVSVPKGNYASVVFIENGEKVGTAAIER